MHEKYTQEDEEVFKGQIKGVILAVTLLQKPCNLKDIEKIIKRARVKIAKKYIERLGEFDSMVHEGLKDFIYNYFVS